MLSLNSRPKPASQFYRKHRKPTSGSSRKPLGLKWRPWFPCPTPSRCVHYLQDVQKYLVIGKHVLQHLHKGLKRLWRENNTCVWTASQNDPKTFNFGLPGGHFGILGLHFGGLVPPRGTQRGPNEKRISFCDFCLLPFGHPLEYTFA